MITFTAETQARALIGIRNGADITGVSTAMCLRQIEREHPEYVDICEAMGEYSVMESQPYFGAIATKAGLQWARKVLKEAKMAGNGGQA